MDVRNYRTIRDVANFASRGVWVQIFEQIGLGQWFRIFTGVVQVTGGVSLR